MAQTWKRNRKQVQNLKSCEICAFIYKVICTIFIRYLLAVLCVEIACYCASFIEYKKLSLLNLFGIKLNFGLNIMIWISSNQSIPGTSYSTKMVFINLYNTVLLKTNTKFGRSNIIIIFLQRIYHIFNFFYRECMFL